jgi:hypothetical protein
VGFRDKVKKNIPKVDLQSHNILIAGTYKSGKTRAWKEITELHYPNESEAATLLAFEPGYNTWELESVIPMHEEDWNFFKKEVVPGLVQEAKDGRVTKVIGIDTVDKMVDMATEHVLKEQNNKYGKKFSSLQEIQEATKTVNGWMLLKDEIWKQISILKNSGYGFMWLSWVKEKETELIDGLKYSSLEMKMPKTGRDIFESEADLICCLYNETKVLDKDGNELNENKTDKKGKDKASNFHSTETYMYFRNSNYISIAGGRFTDLPEKVPYSAQNFLDVYEKAVEGQLKKTKKNVDELKQEETEKREEKAKEYAESKEDVQELIDQINSKIKELQEVKKAGKAGNKFKALYGSANGYRESDDVEALKEGLDFLDTID